MNVTVLCGVDVNAYCVEWIGIVSQEDLAELLRSVRGPVFFQGVVEGAWSW